MVRAKKIKNTKKPAHKVGKAILPAKSKATAPEKHAGGRPLLFQTTEALQDAIDDYFQSCWEEEWVKVLKPEYARLDFKRLKKVPTEDQYHWVPTLDRLGKVRKHQVKPYTITALANHLGTTRDTLLDYQERDMFSDTIKNAKVKIHAYTEECLFEPKIAAGVIFNLKNNYGYKDRVDMTSDDKPLPSGTVNHFNNLSDAELLAIAKGSPSGTSK